MATDEQKGGANSDETDGDEPPPPKPWACYVIEHTCGATYVGVSPDPVRRLRQHNSEIKGGAKYTTSKSANGVGGWRHVCLVRGFRTSVEALQFEWAVKHEPPRGKGNGGIRMRLIKLYATLRRPRWTSKAPPAHDVPLTVEFVDPSSLGLFSPFGPCGPLSPLSPPRDEAATASATCRPTATAAEPLPPYVTVMTRTTTTTISD